MTSAVASLSPRHERQPTLLRFRLGDHLIAHLRQRLRLRPDHHDPFFLASSRKGGVFAQKAVARMNGLRPVLLGAANDGFVIQIRRHRRLAVTDLVRFIGFVPMRRLSIGFGEHRHCLHPQLGPRSKHSNRDLSAVRAQNLRKPALRSQNALQARSSVRDVHGALTSPRDDPLALSIVRALSVAAPSLVAAAATSRASPPFRRVAPASARARASTDVTALDALARRPRARETRPARAASRRCSFVHLFVPIAAAAPRGATTARGIARAVDVDDVRVRTCARNASRTVVRARVCGREARSSRLPGRDRVSVSRVERRGRRRIEARARAAL